MILLSAGLVIWCLVHLMPSFSPRIRVQLVGKLGEIPFKLLFAALLILSIVLMVKGWKATLPAFVYAPPLWGRSAASLLVLITCILFVAAQGKTNLKRWLRHPQLTGLLTWSIAHLLANGDVRSITLFCTLGLWAIVEIILINRREGSWQKPEPVSKKNDILTVVAGIFLYIVLLFAHPYLTGIPLIA